MTTKEIAFRSEDLGLKTWALASVTLALNEALYHGTFGASEYEGAMYLLIQMTQEVSEEANAITESLFATLKTEPKESVNEQS